MKVSVPNTLNALMEVIEGSQVTVTAGVTEGAGVAAVEFSAEFGTGGPSAITYVADAASYQFAFTIPQGSQELVVTITPKDAEGNIVSTLIEEVGIADVAGSLTLSWGAKGFVYIDTIFPQGGVSKEKEFLLKDILVPIGIAPLTQSITALAVDGAGHWAGVAAPVGISFVPDTEIPKVEITNLPDYPPDIESTGIQNAPLPNGSLHDPHNQQAH